MGNLYSTLTRLNSFQILTTKFDHFNSVKKALFTTNYVFCLLRIYFASSSCVPCKDSQSSGQSYQYHLLSASSSACIPALDMQFIILNLAIISGFRRKRNWIIQMKLQIWLFEVVKTGPNVRTNQFSISASVFIEINLFLMILLQCDCELVYQ